jgi:hypothetical protein
VIGISPTAPRLPVGAAVPAQPLAVCWNVPAGVFIVSLDRPGPAEPFAGDPAAIVRIGRGRSPLVALWRWLWGLA